MIANWIAIALLMRISDLARASAADVPLRDGLPPVRERRPVRVDAAPYKDAAPSEDAAPIADAAPVADAVPSGDSVASEEGTLPVPDSGSAGGAVQEVKR